MYVAVSTATAAAAAAAIQYIFILKMSGKANEREGVRALVCVLQPERVCEWLEYALSYDAYTFNV